MVDTIFSLRLLFILIILESVALRKTLSTVGGSLALIIDKPLLEALGISKTSVLDVSIEDGALLVRAAPKRSASSKAELHEWARALLVRVAASSDETLPAELEAELDRFEQVLPIFDLRIEATRGTETHARQAWLQQIVMSLVARPPAPVPILTRQVALAVLEDLARGHGAFREVTAARPFANASPDVVANVLWFLLVRGYVQVHPDSTTIRPTLDRLGQQGRVPSTPPASIADALRNGVTLLRMTPAGGEHLHQLRQSEQPAA